MKRTHLNALIDGLAFAAFLLLLSTGLLLQYQLPVGSGGLEGHGTGGRASERIVQVLWGWTRHEWGQIHYWIAWAMMAILVFHLLLHWKWIVCTLRGKPSSASGYRLLLGCVGLVFVTLLTAVPLMSSTTSASREELRKSRTSSTDAGVETNEESGRTAEESEGLALRGSMTLRQVANQSGVSLNDLIHALGLPPDVDVDSGAGRELRRHNLQMSDLREAIDRVRAGQKSP